MLGPRPDTGFNTPRVAENYLPVNPQQQVFRQQLPNLQVPGQQFPIRNPPPNHVIAPSASSTPPPTPGPTNSYNGGFTFVQPAGQGFGHVQQGGPAGGAGQVQGQGHGGGGGQGGASPVVKRARF